MRASVEQPVWRSLLFVPADNEKFVGKAADRGADAIILDLEDSVLAEQKGEARVQAREAAEHLSKTGQTVLVRVNRPWGMMLDDLEAIVSPHVSAIFVPKSDSVAVPIAIDEILGSLETERDVPIGSTQLFVRIESARGIRDIDAILSTSDRIVATGIGTGDFAFSTGLSMEGLGVPFAHFTASMAARAAGVLPLGLAGSIASFDDSDAFRQLAATSRGLGSVGAPCIHPRQIPILNEIFSPTQREIEWSERILEVFQDSERGRKGAFMLDGEFVDVAMEVHARRIQAAAAKISGS